MSTLPLVFGAFQLIGKLQVLLPAGMVHEEARIICGVAPIVPDGMPVGFAEQAGYVPEVPAGQVCTTTGGTITGATAVTPEKVKLPNHAPYPKEFTPYAALAWYDCAPGLMV